MDLFGGKGFGFNKPSGIETAADKLFNVKNWRGGIGDGGGGGLVSNLGGGFKGPDNLLINPMKGMKNLMKPELPGLNVLPKLQGGIGAVTPTPGSLQALGAGLGNPFQGLQAGLQGAFPALGAAPGLAMAMPVIGGIGLLGELFDWW